MTVRFKEVFTNLHTKRVVVKGKRSGLCVLMSLKSDNIFSLGCIRCGLDKIEKSHECAYISGSETNLFNGDGFCYGYKELK